MLWRYGFSERLAAADAFDVSLGAMRRLAEFDGKSWAEAKKLGDELDKECQASHNPIVAIAIPGLASSSRTSRERKAQLRLLRTAVHYRGTGEVLGLDDPFGAKLLHAEKDGKLKIWSVGSDGTDDGGSGELKPKAGKDIVLEIAK